MDDFGHGTSCAGEIGMIRDNGVCGTGVAFNTRIGGQLYICGMRILKEEILLLSWIQDFLDIIVCKQWSSLKTSIFKYVRRSTVSRSL